MIKPVNRTIHTCYIRIYKSRSGGCVVENMYKCGHDRRDNVKTAKILADKGYFIQLLPDICSTEIELRKRYLSDVYGNKNPDARINSIWIADFKKPAAEV
ncbi:MAG: hypothetical protein ACTHMC_20715 [Pseudobacter sp.]|uniref:hypothetical protein n=1 Tax=Pseudobacter sp. TaxID=2045420 RepID=UPI003F7DBB59